MESVTIFLKIAIILLTSRVENSRRIRTPISIDSDKGIFIRDGKEFRYISGSFHYWRTPAYYWEDRLKKMAASGLNTVQTYVPWHLHEPYKGHFTFDGELNLFKFLSIINKLEMLVILRPGPYIDNLNDLGGLPSWLLWEKKDIKFRTRDKLFLHPVFEWFDVLCPRLVPFLYPNGGPVFAVQVENELGSFPLASEKYLISLRLRLEKHFGQDVILFSTDGAGDGYMKYLKTPRSIFPTIDFGTGSRNQTRASFDVQKRVLKRLGFGPGPLVNSEYYAGWHDFWGRKYESVSDFAAASTLDHILSLNASVNTFMFVGGTIYGFHEGITHGNYRYSATTTWDYDAPISETGKPRTKLFAIRKVVQKYVAAALPPVPGPIDVSICAQSHTLSGWTEIMSELIPFRYIPLKDALDVLSPRFFSSKFPLTFEDLQQDYGYVLYRTYSVERLVGDLTVKGVRDRGVVYVNDKYLGVVNINGNTSIPGMLIFAGDTIDILVESQGRKCYGDLPYDSIFKGLLSNVTVGSKTLTNWQIYPLPLNNTNEILKKNFSSSLGIPKSPSGANIQIPGFFIYNFSIPVTNNHKVKCLAGDYFIEMNSLKKGQLFVNGHNIGRYWTEVGPQKTLFVAQPFLKFSKNVSNFETNIALTFETDGTNPSVTSDDIPAVLLLKSEPILNGSFSPPTN